MPHRLDDVFRGDEFAQCAVYLEEPTHEDEAHARMKKIRYVTGRGGSGVGGLSGYLSTLTRDFDVCPIDPAFLQLDLDNQIGRVREFSSQGNSYVVANSYGAYLFLLSLIDQPASSINVLLLSPVLGRAMSEKRMLFSRPPREATLKRAIQDGRLGMPAHLQIVTGAKDEICDPELAIRVGDQLNIDVSVLADESHMLEHTSVSLAVERFLGIRGK